MSIDVIILREGMTVIRSILDGRIAINCGQNNQVKVVHAIAEALHNFSSSDSFLKDMALKRLSKLFAEYPDLTSLLFQTHGWLSQNQSTHASENG